jgi:hypothetical protein
MAQARRAELLQAAEQHRLVAELHRPTAFGRLTAWAKGRRAASTSSAPAPAPIRSLSTQG